MPAGGMRSSGADPEDHDDVVGHGLTAERHGGRLEDMSARVQAQSQRARALDLLETALAGTLECDTVSIAAALLARFGSVGAVLQASAAQLSAVPDMTPAAVMRLSMINQAHEFALQETVARRDLINSWSALELYLLRRLRHRQIELALGLLLDKKNGLICEVVLGQGTIDHVPLYVREVVRAVIEHGASAFILAHNHPSGDPQPSDADVRMTKAVADGLALFDVPLHDHAIVGRNSVLSMRALRLF